MRIATTYEDVLSLLRETAELQPTFGVDIGKQFGTRIIMHITKDTAGKLLHELRMRDLPCPQVIFTGNKILIGAEP